jgi:hypothetical protein
MRAELPSALIVNLSTAQPCGEDQWQHWRGLLDAGRDEFLKRVPDGIHPQEPGYREVVLLELKHMLSGKPWAP